MVATVFPVASVVDTVATVVATVAMVAPVASAAMVAMVSPVATVVAMEDVASAAMVARLRLMEAQALNTDIRVDTAAGHTDGEEPKMTSQALNARESYQFDGLMRESPVCLVLCGSNL